MRHSLCACLVSAACLAVPGPVWAQGFAVNEHGTCQMGRAGTGTAQPCDDGSAVLYNPAGLAGMRGWTLSAGVTLIDAYGGFTDDLTGASTDLANSLIPVPHAYLAYGINEQWAAGIGMFVPYGLGTEWPLTFEGRFSGYDNDLRSIYIQPTVSWRPHPKIALGAGFDFVIGSVELNQRLDASELPAPPPAPIGTLLGQLGIPFHTDFANGRLRATGATGFGAHFGVLVEPHERVSFGVRYLTRVTLDYEGDATFTPVPTGILLPAGNPFGVPAGTPLDAVLAAAGLFTGPLANGTATTSITMPDQIVVGVAVQASHSLTLLADAQWMNWSVFDRILLDFTNAQTPDRIIEENYEDTWGFRAGFEWAADERWTLRGGYLYHQAAAPDETVTPLLPESVRNELTGGVGLAVNPRFSVDVAYQYIRQDKRRGRVRDPLPGQLPTAALNSGLYTFNANLVGATLTVHF